MLFEVHIVSRLQGDRSAQASSVAMVGAGGAGGSLIRLCGHCNGSRDTGTVMTCSAAV